MVGRRRRAGLRHALRAVGRHQQRRRRDGRVHRAAEPRERRSSAPARACRATASSIVATATRHQFQHRESRTGDHPPGADRRDSCRRPALPTARFTISPTPVNFNVASIFDASTSPLGTRRERHHELRMDVRRRLVRDRQDRQPHLYAVDDAGNAYNVTLTVTNDRGSERSTTQAVTVDASPAPTRRLGLLADGAERRRHHLLQRQRSAARRPVTRSCSYSWNFGDGTTGERRPDDACLRRRGDLYRSCSRDRRCRSEAIDADAPGVVGSGNPVVSFTSPVVNAAAQTMFFDGGGIDGARGRDDRVVSRGTSATALRRPGQDRDRSPHAYAAAGAYAGALDGDRQPGSHRARRSCTVTVPVDRDGRQPADRRPSTPGPEGPGVDRLRPARRGVPPRRPVSGSGRRLPRRPRAPSRLPLRARHPRPRADRAERSRRPRAPSSSTSSRARRKTSPRSAASPKSITGRASLARGARAVPRRAGARAQRSGSAADGRRARAPGRAAAAAGSADGLSFEQMQNEFCRTCCRRRRRRRRRPALRRRRRLLRTQVRRRRPSRAPDRAAPIAAGPEPAASRRRIDSACRDATPPGATEREQSHAPDVAVLEQWLDAIHVARAEPPRLAAVTRRSGRRSPRAASTPSSSRRCRTFSISPTSPAAPRSSCSTADRLSLHHRLPLRHGARARRAAPRTSVPASSS